MASVIAKRWQKLQNLQQFTSPCQSIVDLVSFDKVVDTTPVKISQRRLYTPRCFYQNIKDTSLTRRHSLKRSLFIDETSSADDTQLEKSPSKRIKYNGSVFDDKVTQDLPSADTTVGYVCEKQTLQTIPGHHSDLKYISPKTLESIIETKSEKNVVIVDCRYPYEYNGGHINGALNLYSREAIHDHFIKQSLQYCKTTEPTIIVFHCEFSSERGPKMCRFLREQDRQVHADCYPKLYYPEIYVLHGGYKAFYEETFTNHCQPKSYRSMFHKEYKTEMKQYRQQTKTWGRFKSWHGRDNKCTTTLCF